MALFIVYLFTIGVKIVGCFFNFFFFNSSGFYIITQTCHVSCVQKLFATWLIGD